MNRLIRTAILSVAVATSLVAIATAAQKPFAAPVPAQILSAKNVFIANGGSSVSSAETISPNLPYDEFYAAVQAWGRFELLPTPTEADLVLELRFVAVPASTPRGVLYLRRQLELLFIDPKTHITLWTMYEQFDEDMDSNKRKDLDTGIDALVRDLKRLTAPPGSASQANPAAPDKQEKPAKHIW